MAFEYAAPEQHPERAEGGPGILGAADQPRSAVQGTAAAGMGVERHAQFFADLPDRLVARVVPERFRVVSRQLQRGEQDAAEQIVLLRPSDLLDPIFLVIQRDERDTRMPAPV